MFPSSLLGGNCFYSISGIVVDHINDQPLEAVGIYVKESQKGVITDSTGKFKINNLCHGDYHLVISHIGCQAKEVFVHLHSDTILHLEMDHSTHWVQSVEISGHTNPSSQKEEHIHEQEIVDKVSSGMTDVLKDISGVAIMKNGGITKPIVHGLYGNRLSILNNGLPQAGQQWGNDHSPEIDPLSATQIKVIKGSAVLEYFGAGLGSVILIEPKRIAKEPHLHGRASSFYQTNGRGLGTNIQMKQYGKFMAWRANATIKKRGDFETPDYYLTNTGASEMNFSLQLEKELKRRWFFSSYFSSFNTEIGVHRGSHIGNLTDLEAAFSVDVPFFTDSSFSYEINAPRQDVGHHLAKLSFKKSIDSTQQLYLLWGGQINDRKEFDVRRAGRTSKPSVSLTQYSSYSEVKYQKRWDSALVKMGVQSNFIDNYNISGTGTAPLIPDYLSYQTGAYFIYNRQWKKQMLETGLRYEYFYRYTVQSSNSNSTQFNRFYENRLAYSANILWKKVYNNASNFSIGLGVAQRAPAINELYSFGLHQGVAAIEEGDPNLQAETSFKLASSFDKKISDKWRTSLFIFGQYIKDYIYLQPQDNGRLTIRGAFPLLVYRQVDGIIMGVDWINNFELLNGWSVETKLNYLEGIESDFETKLVFIPASRIALDIQHEWEESLRILGIKLNNTTFEWQNLAVAKREGLNSDQDFAATPNAYFLTGMQLSTNVNSRKIRWRLVLKVENLLNTRYRDYLNRLRYFADEIGRNLTVGITANF